MDVIFEISKGRQLAIEVGFFDTVLEMKEKIHKYGGFPITRQTLVFNGQVMADERDTEFYQVLQGSRIKLFIAPPDTVKRPVLVKVEPVLSTKIQLLIKIPTSKKQFSLGIDIGESVVRLKERIHEVDGLPVNRFALSFAGVELQDHRTLGDYSISDLSEVNVIIKPSFPSVSVEVAAVTTTGGGSTTMGGGVGGSSLKRLKLMVLPKCGTKKIPVEMNASDNVGELRKELQRLHQHLHFHLPTEGYFFIYKQNVMDDDHSFRWHDVREGDTIEIFNGSVTGGS